MGEGSNNPLFVDLVELQLHANQLDMHAEDMKEVHDAAHRAMTDAQAGFGSGRSSKALGERISAWEQETSDHHAEIKGHGKDHRTAAVTFQSGDDRSRRDFEQVQKQLPPSSAV